MLRRLALLPAALSLLPAQPAPAPAWKEFSMGPATRRVETTPTNIRQGVLRANSISLRSLIGIAAGVSPVRVLGPDWLAGEHFAVAAMISDESRLRLRTRLPDDPGVAGEFRSLLTRELVQRFQLEFHRETRPSAGYTLQPAGGLMNLRPAKAGERGQVTLSNPAFSSETTLDAHSVTFRTISDWLQGHFKQPVTDAPSLPEGSYDFHLEWKTGDDTSLLAALREQAGLLLAAETRSLEYVVVDHVERPPGATQPAALETAAITAPEPDSSVRYDPAELRKDLRVAWDALVEGHPGIYRFTAKPELDRIFTAASAGFTRPMTALELYRVLAPAVAALKCGHTALQPSRAIELRVQTEPLIPIQAAVLGGRVFVARDLSGGGKLTGGEILAINGVGSGRILTQMLAVAHGDGDSATAGPYQLSHDYGFARNLYLVAGLQSPFRVRYMAKGESGEAVLTGLPLDAMRAAARLRYPEAPRAGNASWSVLAGGTAGLLRITAFAGRAGDGTPLRAFFERAFTELRDRRVPALILDVRDNGGGEDDLGRELFSYFADGPFRYYHDLVINKLSFRFRQYVPNRAPLPPHVNDLVRKGTDGKYHMVGHPNWGTLQAGAPHFGGKVVVLMNGGTFSTTCEFLAMLHHRGGATFVGEETGGGYYGNTSGAAFRLVLPNSKLVLPVPVVGYYMAIDGAAQGRRGIRPDREVTYSIEDIVAGRDKAMEAALELVAR